MVSVKSQLKLAVCEATVSVTDGNVSPSTLNGGGAHREDRSDPIRSEPNRAKPRRAEQLQRLIEPLIFTLTLETI